MRRFLHLLPLFALLPHTAALATPVLVPAPLLDRWMYPFNGTPGTRPLAPTFGAVGETDFDERDAQFLLGFDTSAAATPGLGAASYQILSMRLTLQAGGGDFAYDPSPDDYRTYLASGGLPDTDTGRPVELFGVGYRNGNSSATFGETSPFAPPGPPARGVRNAYALGFREGVVADVSNFVDSLNGGADGFNPTSFGIGQSSLMPGDAVPPGTDYVFDLNLADPGVLAYLQAGLNVGKLDFMATSMHPASFGGAATYPIWNTKETNPLIGQGPQLLLEVAIIPEPGVLGLLGLALALLRVGRLRGAVQADRDPRAGFTLIELLVVMGIAAILISLFAAGLSGAMGKARQIREVAAARTLVTGIHLHATENEGQILPGYANRPATGPDGQALPHPVNARYPWRLAPYLGKHVEGVFLLRDGKDRGPSTSDAGAFAYSVSVHPALGMNVFFVGGDESGLSGAGIRPIPEHETLFGRFCVTRMDQAHSPSTLLVFASARHSHNGKNGRGYFKVEAPRLTGPRWTSAYDADGEAANSGFVDLRHRGRAVAAMLDGHVSLLGEKELRDMRRWSNQASEAGDAAWTLRRL